MQQSLHRRVRSLCKRAGVPLICIDPAVLSQEERASLLRALLVERPLEQLKNSFPSGYPRPN